MSAPEERLTAPSCRPASQFQPEPDEPTEVAAAKGGQCIVVVRGPKEGEKDPTRVLMYVRDGSAVTFTATAQQAASNCCVVDLPDPVEKGNFDRDAISKAISVRLGWNPLWQ